MAKGDISTVYDSASGKWKNITQGRSRAFGTHQTKADATAEGRDAAIRRGVEHQIHNMDGQIGSKNTYPRSRDRHPPKG